MWHYCDDVIVQVSDGAREYVGARGGRLFLRTRTIKCCSGATTFMDASTMFNGDESSLSAIDNDDLDVRFLDRGLSPQMVSVELRGRLRPHLVANWDGCAYRL